jgi:hypothetical protein
MCVRVCVSLFCCGAAGRMPARKKSEKEHELDASHNLSWLDPSFKQLSAGQIVSIIEYKTFSLFFFLFIRFILSMRWEVNRDLIRWSTDLHGSRLLALSLWSGVIVIDQGNNNNKKRRRKRFVTFYLCRWIMSVTARWRQGGNKRRGVGGVWTFQRLAVS